MTTPWAVHVVGLGKQGEEAAEAAERLYEELREAGIEALLDDRAAGAGEKLTDAELLGCPLRVVVGKRTLAEGAGRGPGAAQRRRPPARGCRRGAADARDPRRR